MTTKATKKFRQDFAKRLNDALNHINVPPVGQGRIQFVADLFDLTHAGAGKWVNGTALPPKKRRKEIAEKLGIHYNWLEYSQGAMTETPQDQPTQQDKERKNRHNMLAAVRMGNIEPNMGKTSAINPRHFNGTMGHATFGTSYILEELADKIAALAHNLGIPMLPGTLVKMTVDLHAHIENATNSVPLQYLMIKPVLHALEVGLINCNITPTEKRKNS